MDSVLKQNDIINIEEAGRYLVVKSIILDEQVYHYLIKLKESQENPEVLFVAENIDDEENLDLQAVTDTSLIEKLMNFCN